MAAARTMQATCQFFRQCCVHSGAGAASSGAAGSSSSSGTSAREARPFVPRGYYSRHSQDATAAAAHLLPGRSKTRRELSCSSSSSSSCSFVAPSPARNHYGRLKCRQQQAGNGIPLAGRGSRITTCAVAETAVEEASQDSPGGPAAEEATGPREWNAATVLRVDDIAPGVRNVVLEVEASREYVALENAYTLPGQLASVKVPTTATAGGSDGNGSVGRAGESQDAEMTTLNVTCSSAPFSMEVNRVVLLKLRGDISAGESKVVQYMMSVKAPLELFVEEAKAEALYDLPVGAEVMVGPFQKTGMDFLPIMFLVRYPTILVFTDDGPGIAAARAMIEAKDVGSLMLNMREDVRLYYAAEKPSTVAYRDSFPEWESTGVKVRATVRDVGEGGWDGFVGSFSQLFDEDDLEYDPESTAAVVCGSRKTIDEVMRVLEDAGIPATQVVQWESR
ncbi:hypothetical protein CBR_g8311 [Chara braunii]|uniref:FAD-binding FR-type domain-containing protein n=1 Tax=Chara braunii TaxID=69332 RepID=A0A388KM36_CHABU|nr:hypothetical protein CBR_g8311 [Chara braunii]|eukprot:GBG71013.1 hypothetical protein CBR_g8311 [Chara braunii]